MDMSPKSVVVARFVTPSFRPEDTATHAVSELADDSDESGVLA